jgi:hypothetical protein
MLTSPRNTKILYLLSNPLSDNKIPLRLGVNEIKDKMLLRELSNKTPLKCKNLIFFKLMMHSKDRATLRSYSDYPIIVRIRQGDSDISEISIKNSGLLSINFKYLIGVKIFSADNTKLCNLYLEDYVEGLEESLLVEEVAQAENVPLIKETEEIKDIIIIKNEENNTDFSTEISSNTNSQFFNENVSVKDNNILIINSKYIPEIKPILKEDDLIIIPKNILPLINIPKEEENETHLLKRKRNSQKRQWSIVYQQTIEMLKSQKNTPCTICLDQMKIPSKVDECEHLFCKECIDQWANMSNTCPLCKIEFKKITFLSEDKNLLETRRFSKKKFKYEEDENDLWMDNCLEYCMACKNTNDMYLMLVCDKCHFNVCHTYCDGLDTIPDDEWFCSECNPPKPKGKKQRGNNFYSEPSPMETREARTKREHKNIKGK